MADLFQGDAHLGLDSLYRYIQEIGHFTVFEAALFDEQEDELTFGREAIDGGIDTEDHFRGNEDLLRTVLPFDAEIMEIVFRYFRSWLSEVLEGLITGAFEQVQLWIDDLGQQVLLLPDIDEYIIGDLFGCLFIADDGVAEFIQPIKVELMQIGEGRFILR